MRKLTSIVVSMSFLLSLTACGGGGDSTSTNEAPTASNVNITDNNGGSAVMGDSLTGNYTYADTESDSEGTSTFRWLRAGTAISGAITTSYTLVAADSGSSIIFEMTPVAASGTTTGDTVTSSGISVNSAPTASNVSISDNNGGTALAGDSLSGTYTYADVDNDIEGASTFRWLRAGVAISGATTESYTLVAADSSLSITFEVTPVAASGTITGGTVTSSGITISNSAPTANNVSITDTNGGTALVGDSLSGTYTYADVDNDIEGASTFRWLRAGVAISGATTESYTLVAADSDLSITFEVTPVAASGMTTGTAATSSGITVTNSAPTAINVSISDNNGGTALVGDSLSGTYTYADVDNDIEGASTFRWLRAGVAISGATTESYTLVAADSGLSITFEVTPVAASGTITGGTVTSSGITISNSAPTANNVSITDTNGGTAVVGDTLVGNYTYADADNDTEGTSTFRWLRAGTGISGATAKNYTLVTTDRGKTITFEVTPIAGTGTTTGSAVISSGIAVPDTIAPNVTSTSPSADATGSARNGAITATFDEDIFASTVGTTSFTLSNDNNVKGAVTFDANNNIASFTPANALPLLTSHTATLSTAITDLSGNGLASNYTWSFTTADAEWKSIARLSIGGNPGVGPSQVAFDSNGNAIAVWPQHDGTRYNIYSKRYVAGTGWGSGEVIETGPASTSSPQVAIDSNGHAIAVWVQNNNIRSNRYVAGTGWGTAEVIETDTGLAFSPQVAIDSNGNALAVWEQYDGTRTNIWSNRYVVGTGWGTAALIETDNSGYASYPQVTIDSKGNALAVWYQSDGTRNNIWSNRYVAGTGWDTATLIETDNTGGASSPQVAIDSNGHAMAVWHQHDGTRDNIWSNRYVAGTGWGTAELVETDNTGGASSPQVAIDSNGNALTVWQQDVGSAKNIWSNRYVAGTGWGTAELIETDTGYASSPQVAIDSNGHALAVWLHSDTLISYSNHTSNIYSNRYVAGTGWGTAAEIGSGFGSLGGRSMSPQVAIDSNGNAWALWGFEEILANYTYGYRYIYSNRFE